MDEVDGKCKTSSEKEKDEIIFKSPFYKKAIGLEVPNVSLPKLLFSALDKIYDVVKDNIWVMDVIKETSYKFSDIKPLTTRFASALTRIGFKKEEYKRQMLETSARFIVCDPETAPSVKWAAGQLDWPTNLLSIGGEVEGATSVEEMIETDDGTAFPHDMEINSKEDILAIPNTSGSTGVPKGAMHSHYNFISLFLSLNSCGATEMDEMIGKSVLTSMGNFGVAGLGSLCRSIASGYSNYSISKFDHRKFVDYLLKFKPSGLYIYPYVASWLARAPELNADDFSFIRRISLVGTVMDLATAKILSSKLPQMQLTQSFAMSETLILASSELTKLSDTTSDKEEKVAGLKYKKLGEEYHVSSGILLPLVEAKIVDSESRCTVGHNKRGSLWIRCPYIMKGYLRTNSAKGYVSQLDEEGWLDTGDLAFIDETFHLYVLERRNFIFKYYTHQVSPAELEAVIGEHPAVLSVGVVGIPNPITTSVARAFVVLRPGCQATEEEIKSYVAERKEFYKHLHGGVEFVDYLPENRGGKLDRNALVNRAISNKK
ncbi:hypothetical protein J437_LFUL005545 [Ladona fulva]|uniref:Uncharacterized protein n=1 Tax=Ladona fulva TaxID=123851 RepID=A0A8K0JWW0_LADFU|nr:hypothetical protein J437_LFUL005545 [Ladona fulva]